MAKKLVYWGLMVAIVLGVLETVLRLAGIQRTYSEQTGGDYVSYYNQVLPTWYHGWVPNKDIVYNDPDIHCHYPANSLGLREKEIPKQKPDSVKRLFFLGDFFTEGVGVEYPFSMPRCMEKKLDSAKLGFEVYDVGVSGSDPIYEYVQLRDQILPLHPTHVIVSINGSDIKDIIFRGGMERFHADGTTHYRKGPFWEPLYHNSRLVRFVLACIQQDDDQTFLSAKEMNVQMEAAKKDIFNALVAMKTLCGQHGIKLVVVVHPFPNTMTSSPMKDDILDMTRQYPMQQVNMVNTFADFAQVMNKDNYLEYSLKTNGHYNPKGYQLFADIVFNKINQQYPQYWQ